MTTQTIDWRRDVFSRTMLICIFTGFSSGLPLYLLINLIPAWLRVEGVDLKEIGLFALIGLPYAWKFVWSPFMDQYSWSTLGRRRSWMLLTQIALLVSIALLGWFSPLTQLKTIALLCVLVAFFSASQDIALDAYRREILSDRELGIGNSIHSNAYRLASLVPGSLALILADHLAWSSVFIITALFMLPGMIMTLLVTEPHLAATAAPTLRETILAPFKEFIQRQGFRQTLYILLFIILYKLGDSLATSLSTPFYLDMGYSKSHIGLVAKHAALWPSIAGGLLGGLWMLKIGINRALWLFGVVQIISILGFAWLASLGHHSAIGIIDLLHLAIVISCEAFGMGLGASALIAYIARTTNPIYSATQLALLTSVSAIPRTFINASTGYIVDAIGWTPFFLLCTVLALPGMTLLIKVAPWKKTYPGAE